jgi:trehalose/maltose transport system substrate-binding protein
LADEAAVIASTLDRYALAVLLVAAFWLPPAGAADAPVELTISCGRFPAEVGLCREAAMDWAEASGHRVRVLSAPESPDQRLGLYQELLGVRTDRIDVLEIDIVWAGGLADHLLDLRPYLDGEEQSFLAALIDTDTVDGRLAALPWFVDLGLLFYRQDLLVAAEVPVPVTWSGLEYAATRIQDSRRGSGDDRFWGWLWQGRPGEGLTCNAVEWIASWRGGAVVERDGRVSVDNPRASFALARAARWLRLISPESVLADAEAETLDRFAAGNAAFMRHWPYAWEVLQAPGSAVRGRVGVAMLPRGGSGGRHAAAVGGWQLAVSRYSRHPEQAVDLVRHLTSAAVQRARAVEHGYLPTRRALLSDEEVLAAAPYMRFLAPGSGITLASRPSTVTGSWYPEVSRLIQNAALHVLMAGGDPDTAVRRLADALDLLSQNGTNWSERPIDHSTADDPGSVTDHAQKSDAR